MLLHLCDDEKFIDHVIEMFETVAPGESIYYIHLSNDGILNNVKTQNKSIIKGENFIEQFQKHSIRLTNFDAIILHNIFDSYKINLLLNTNSQTRFHWMCWGADLYNLSFFSKGVYLKQSRQIFKENLNLNGKIGLFLSENCWHFNILIHKWLLRLEPQEYKIKKSLKRIDSVSTVIPSDYDLIKSHIKRKIEYKRFKYISIEGVLKKNIENICVGHNFLIGNSATLTNNHIEAFWEVKSIDFDDRKIIVPLSYGDKNYANRIIQCGKELFPNSFFPLVEFLPLDTYNKILEDCGNVIMNHLRQQALGNIITSLWLGARVFLNNRNPVYSYLLNSGIKVFEMKDLKNIENLPDFYSLAQMNRSKILKIYGRNQVLKETKELVDYLTKKN